MSKNYINIQKERTPNVIYGYARVSTKQQADGHSLKAQEMALKEAGAEIIFKNSFTGTVAEHPEFNKLLSLLKGGRYFNCH